MKTELLRLFLTTISALCFCAPLTCSTSAAANPRDEVVWQSRGQFIRIVPRENTTGSTANEHPAQVQLSMLRRALSRPTITTPDAGKPLPLFGAAELDLLAEHVTAALQRCSSDEEIVFAIFGYHPALMGLAKEEQVTTGRVFLEGGELNLILGMVHRKVDSREDRRLAPFLPGSRSAAARLEVQLSPGSKANAVRLKRSDWLVFRLTEETPDVAAKTAAPNDNRGKVSVEERLLQLRNLLDKKLITNEEYSSTRKRILDEL